MTIAGPTKLRGPFVSRIKNEEVKDEREKTSHIKKQMRYKFAMHRNICLPKSNKGDVKQLIRVFL